MQDLQTGLTSYMPQTIQQEPEMVEPPHAGWFRTVRKVCEVMTFTSGASTLHLLVRSTAYNPVVILVVSGIAIGGLLISSRWAEYPGQKARMFWLGSAIATGTLLAWWDWLQLMATVAATEAKLGVGIVFGILGWMIFQLWRSNRIYRHQQSQQYQPYYGGFNYDPPQ